MYLSIHSSYFHEVNEADVLQVEMFWNTLHSGEVMINCSQVRICLFRIIIIIIIVVVIVVTIVIIIIVGVMFFSCSAYHVNCLQSFVSRRLKHQCVSLQQGITIMLLLLLLLLSLSLLLWLSLVLLLLLLS